jgi:hypothetical protein
MIGHIIWQLFYWPAGIVLGNLLANIIWESPSQIIHARRLRKHHDKIKEHIDSVGTRE